MEKLVVITGASRGLGLTLAEQFIGRGWSVIGIGRSPRPAELPEQAHYSRFDAGDAKACTAFWEQTAQEYARASVCLVNNAGSYITGGLLGTSLDDYEQQMRSCFFAAVNMTHELAANYAAGRIINVISTSALKAHRNNSAYGAAKAAEMHFFHSLQEEFKPEQYEITNLYPSDIATSGPNPSAIAPEDLSAFILEIAEAQKSYYLRDVTIYPFKRS
jgi:3-oxoacyl-[acyl-carrier protein] reductase